VTTRSKRKLIEVALPLEMINAASAREKSIRHGHPSTLHLWWARRPLAACRAVLFASLVDDPSSDPDRFPTSKAVEEERTRLFGIIERLVQWENLTNEAVLKEARAEILRSTDGNPPPVLDPFCGGGSIPLEAQRLGLTAYASDLNPVAVLITKALIEIPPKFGNLPPVHPDARLGVGASGTWKGAAGLAEDVRRYGAWMRDEAERRIGHLYPKVRLPKEQGGGEATVIAWLWARTVACPNPACGARMPLVRSFGLSTKKGKETWVQPIVDRAAKTVRFGVGTGRGTPPEAPKVGRGASFRCLVCDQVASEDHIKVESRAGRMNAQLMAIVAEGQRSRAYLPPSPEHDRIAHSAERPEGVLDEEMNRDSTNLVSGRGYGFYKWRDLFTPRQLVALTTFSDLVVEARECLVRDAVSASDRDPVDYGNAVATYLAFAVAKSADFWSTIATWSAQPKNELVVSTFRRQALPMTWDFGEINPFSDSGGNFLKSLDSVGQAVAATPAAGSAVAVQRDATSVVVSQPAMVSTDPPYYDNIGYADLSDFFYVWLRRSLGDLHPELFRTLLTPKADELVASPYRFGGSKAEAEEHFEVGLGAAFKRIRDIADEHAPVTVYYAFKQTESETHDGATVVASTGWETMLEGLLGNGFSIDGTWPMHTERAGRSISIGANALASSVVIACRPRRADAGITTRRDFVASLKAEMPSALRTLQHGSIAPVDLDQAAIGPGMSIFSRYAKVLEPDGSAMRVRTALALINDALDEIVSEMVGEFDADTRWAIAWYDQFGMKDAEFGLAETRSRAKNTSIRGLVDAGIVAAARGRVRLLDRSEYAWPWDPATDRRTPVWEATQRLVHVLLNEGESSAGELLSRLGSLGDTARDLAYHLYQVAGRKGWADEARVYNALAASWTDLARNAETLGGGASPAQGTLGLES
jgi:putative DNA methylase